MNSITTTNTSQFNLRSITVSKPSNSTYGKRVFLNTDAGQFLLKTVPLDMKFGLSRWDNNGSISYSLNAYSGLDFFRTLETRVKELVAENSQDWLGMKSLTVETIDNLSLMYPLIKSGKSGDNVKFNFPLSNGVFTAKVYNNSNEEQSITEDNYRLVIGPNSQARLCFGVSLFISTSKKVSITLTTKMVKITETKKRPVIEYADVFSDDEGL